MESCLEVKFVYQIVNICFSCILACASLWIVRRYLNILFKKKAGNHITILVWAAFYLFQLWLEYNLLPSVWNLITNVILVFLLTLTGFRGTIKRRCFSVILLYVTWSLTEMVIYYLIALTITENSKFNMLGSSISKLMMMMLVHILGIKLLTEGKELLSFKYYFVLLFVPMGSMVIAHNTVNLDYQEQQKIIIFGILLVINMIIFELYKSLMDNLSVFRKNIVYEQQMELLSRNTNEQEKTMEEFYAEKHNLYNQLIVLQETIKEGNKNEAINDIETLIHSCTDHWEQISNSGNKIIDVLINSKYSVARGKGIVFQLRVFIPQKLPFQNCDLGVIIGNALDNAIEAAEQCRDENRTIEVAMGIRRSSFVIVIKNSYVHALKKDSSGNLITTKREKKNHGYGVSSIKRAAEKYQGEVLMDTEEAKFSLTIILNMELL